MATANTIRLRLKVTDLVLQVGILLGAIAVGIWYQLPEKFVMAHPVMGILQFISLTLHFKFGSGTTHSQSQRQLMQWIIYGFVGFTALVMCFYFEFFLFSAFIWFFVGPLFYIWYFIICFNETIALIQPTSTPQHDQ
jgi:hypothetical protein